MEPTAQRVIGNYGECTLTMTRLEDGRIELNAQTSCRYGDEWPFIPGEYEFAPYQPYIQDMLIELGVCMEPTPDRE